MLPPGLLQATSCPGVSKTGQCLGANGVDPSTVFRIGTDGLTVPLPAVSQTLAQDLAKGVSGGKTKQAHEALSDREFQIMRLIASGKSVKEIAFDLNLSIKTVSTYRTRLLKKLRLTTTADVIRYAVQERLVE